MAEATLTDAQRVAWLRLIRTDNVGPQTFRQLINREGSAQAAIDALPGLAKSRGIGVKVPSKAQAEDEIAATAKLGGRIVASSEPGYPTLLRYIGGAPPLVTIAGGDRLDYGKTVAIVGARNASTAGQKMTRLLATEKYRAF